MRATELEHTWRVSFLNDRNEFSLLNRIGNEQYLHDADPSVAFVWCVPLACGPGAEQQFSELLDPIEAARAARFATPDERRRYVVSHGAVRLILSAFIGRDARDIQIAVGTWGKPHVAGPGPNFSLSHDGDVALVAVTKDAAIGVDVERVRPELRLDTFVRPLMQMQDVVRIDALKTADRTRAWFAAWTRLEAVAKAYGKGLGDDIAADAGLSARFRIWNLDVDDMRVGAVATTASVAHVVYEELPSAPSALARLGWA